jgi:hypothetical protein
LEALEIAVVPLDVARRGAMRLATKSPRLTRILSRRDSRIACLASLQVAALFALSLRFPVALFFLGPVFLGVIHLAADIRYLALHRAPPRALVITSVAIAFTITAVRLSVGLHLLRAGRGEQVDVILGLAWVGAALAFALRGRARQSVLALPLFLGVAAYLFVHAHLTELALIHVHNVIAVLAWLVLFRRRVSWGVVPLALVVGLAAVLLSGVYLPWTMQHDGLFAFGVGEERIAAWLAPGVRPAAGMALAVTFVFLQGVHYAVWTGWIPQDDLRHEGTPTFRMSVRALKADFGAVGLSLLACLALGMAGFAAWSIRDAVSWYMTLAKSHAWFECALLSFFVVSGSARRVSS